MPEERGRNADGRVFVSSAADDLTAEVIEHQAAIKSPVRKAWEDVVVLGEELWYLPNLAFPLKKPRALPGVPKGPSIALREYPITAVVTILELPVIACVIPAFILLPGWAFISLGLLSLLALWLLARVLWGPVLVESTTTGFDAEKFAHEKWIFMNGIATGHLAVQRSVNNLAATFQRPFLGIYNRTMGIVGDLIECLVQRSFQFSTFDARVATETIRAALLDDNIRKVVVIAHSQGGIIVSLALDQLYATVPAHALRKLEIYTFGSAAAQFHDPLTQTRSAIASQILTESPATLSRKSTFSSLQDSQILAAAAQPTALAAPTYLTHRIIPYIEHYCNQKDPVPRWGVLYHIRRANGTTYAGRVFTHENASGHFFDQHYLDSMLPMDKIDDRTDPHLFLNHIVRFGERGVLRAATLHSLGHGTDTDAAPAGTEDVVVDALPDVNGGVIRVRDLSRLWRYVNGKEPLEG